MPGSGRSRKAHCARPDWEVAMEFLNFVLMFVAAYILLRKPEKERLAFRLLVVSVLLMVALFSIATRTALLPGVNY
jgi:lipopolysaccharide export LptBFGC system permease protein LptF